MTKFHLITGIAPLLFLVAAWAGCSSSDQQQIETAFRIALGRSPDEEEMKWSVELLRRHVTRLLREKIPNDEANRKALAHLCHMLFNTNEFLYVE